MKKQSLFLFLFIAYQTLYSQIVYQQKFNNLTLSTYTTVYVTTQYTDVPSSYIQVNEGYKNNTGSSLRPNAPFHTDSLRKKGWAVVYNDILKDTFLVSTSWVDTNKIISRWCILPVMSGISINSVLHWKAMSPDPTYADGYAVYISTNTSTIDTSIFNNSNKVFQISDNSVSGGGEKQQWTHRSISLANYTGQSIRIAFKNISNQKYQLWIDDITIENLPNTYDAKLQNLGNLKYMSTNQAFNLMSRLQNMGYQNISNVNLAYSIQGVAYNNQSFSLNQNLLPLSTTDLVFTNTLTINTPGIYQVKIWINQINGQIDQNHFNDTISYYLSVMSASATPKILIEQITDATFSDAPACQDTLLYFIQQDTNIIVTQIHQQDSLQCNLSKLHSRYFEVPENQPIALINRKYILNKNKNYFFRNELRNSVTTVKNTLTPCYINIFNIIADTITKTIQLDVSVGFYQNAKGDYRVNVYLAENNVYGDPTDTTINGYNQSSSFYFTPYSNYYQQGYFSSTANTFILNAYQYKHQFVTQQALNGIYGDISVVPTTPTASATYSKTYTLSVPSTSSNVFKYRFNNLYAIAYIYEHDTLIQNRQILNATKIKINTNAEIVSVFDIQTNNNFNLYPNPASYHILLKGLNEQIYRGKILNALGEEVLNIRSDITDISMLPSGVYVILIQTIHGKIFSKKLIIQR